MNHIINKTNHIINKTKKLFSVLVMFILLGSCDVVDKTPLDIISDAVVWEDQVLIDSYLTEQYAQTPVLTNDATDIEGKYGVGLVGNFYVNELADEATYNWGFYNRFDIANLKGGDMDIQGGYLEYWELPYRTIRALNLFLEKLEEAPVSEEFKKVRAAEARFLRSFNYFAMVKRYGGVPLIIKAQKLNDSKEELYPKRNSEKEIYDFIIQEMDEIASMLPNKVTKQTTGRPSKMAALAFKSRVALYAGSIAKYGDIQLGGLLGFSKSDANSYFQKSYDASMTIINSGIHKLYNNDSDKSKNFQNIFLNENNDEVIMSKCFDGINTGGVAWGYDFAQAPKPHAWDAGNKDAPYLEMVEEFEKIDGTSGKLNREELESKSWSMAELWGGRDPRLKATIYTQDTPWKNEKVEFYNGLITENGSIIYEGSYKGKLVQGKQIIDGTVGTSFGVMKYLDPNCNNLEGIPNSKTDYIVFRYGEVLLNMAEAAFELEKKDDALNGINQIRDRAGIPPITSVSMDAIRHERKVELAFEGHRYWDLRRWRLAEKELTGGRTGIRYFYEYPSGKYKIKLLPNVEVIYGKGGKMPLFRPYYYYFPITLGRTGANPNLVENPGY